MNVDGTVDPTTRTAYVGIVGDLDYDTCDDFVDTVSQLLTEHPGMENLHLDCSELDFCDSAGLSALLLVHRRTSQLGVNLHLDRRPHQLDRILDITGILEHLAAPVDIDAATRRPVVIEDSATESGTRG